MVDARCLISFAAAALLLTGCLGPGTTRSPRLFVLSAIPAPLRSEAAASDLHSELRLGVGRITLPERLNRLQIVTQTGENEIHAADLSQWAEPLEESIPRVLAENLSALVGTERVSTYPWPTKMDVDLWVEMAVIRFEGNAGGDVSLAARWRLIRANGSEAQPLRLSTYSEPSADRSTEALVAAMSRAVASLSRDIAAAIAMIPR